MTDIPVEQLKKRLARGETEAFVELYDLFGTPLNRYLTVRLNAQDASDVLQDVFARLVRYHRKLGKAKNLEAYVLLTARNEANRWLLKNKKHKAGKEPGDFRQRAAEIPNPDQPNGQLEASEQSQRLLKQLGEEDRQIVELKFFSELTFADIGNILKIPAPTAASKYRRAILKLKKSIESERDASKAKTTKNSSRHSNPMS